MKRTRRTPGEKLKYMIMEVTADGSKLFWLLVVSYVILGGLFSYFESQTLFDSFYFAVVTGQTVGFGDISPKTPEGKLIVMVFIVWSFLLWTMVIAWVVDNTRKQADKWSHDEQEQLEAAIVRIEQALGTLPQCWSEFPPTTWRKDEHAATCTCAERVQSTSQ